MLGALQERFRAEPVNVVSIHSNKFPAEAERDRIAAAMSRYDVRHPVAIDRGRELWQSYTVKAWPTLVFLRPDATIAAAVAGEQSLESLASIVDEILAEARDAGTLGTRFEPRAAASPSTGSPLHQPAGLAATSAGLAISDTGNHRVIVVDRARDRILQIGDGEPGFTDGPSGSSRFRAPRGLASAGDTLFVADSGNHAIRAVDLESGAVRTTAGTGELGLGVPQELTDARGVALRSPWDLEIVDDVLFVAMAGAHQLWAVLPEAGTTTVFAGSGREALVDGALHEAAFAQPSGLALGGRRLYVADAETSAVRVVDLDAARVSTLVGAGLFDFGDLDDTLERARLQHVQAAAVGPHGLLVADTFNDKIKHVDETKGRVSTWWGSEASDGLADPSAVLQLAGGQVVVADTNHDRILVLDGARESARTLPLPDHLTRRSQ